MENDLPQGFCLTCDPIQIRWYLGRPRPGLSARRLSRAAFRRGHAAMGGADPLARCQQTQNLQASARWNVCIERKKKH